MSLTNLLVRCFCILFLGFLVLVANAQQTKKDSILSIASAQFLKLMNQNAALYNGAEYVEPKQLIEGFPFFGQEAYYNGNLTTSGIVYYNVPIHFDLLNDVLLIWSYDRSRLLMLNTEKVERFTLENETFVKAQILPGAQKDNRNGFYQLLHEGGILVLAKKQKVIVQKSASDKSYAFYKQFNKYFIVVEGEWTEVSSKKSVLALFKQKRDDLKGYIAKENLNFRKAPEVFLKKVVAFYEGLN